MSTIKPQGLLPRGSAKGSDFLRKWSEQLTLPKPKIKYATLPQAEFKFMPRRLREVRNRVLKAARKQMRERNQQAIILKKRAKRAKELGFINQYPNPNRLPR